MTIIFHRTIQTEFMDRLQEAVAVAADGCRMHVSDDIEAFVQMLLLHRIQRPIVVVGIGTMEDVAAIKELSDILDGLYLIVAMDGDDDRLLLSCRQLYPRFLTCDTEDLGVITAVIGRRLARMADGSSSLNAGAANFPGHLKT